MFNLPTSTYRAKCTGFEIQRLEDNDNMFLVTVDATNIYTVCGDDATVVQGSGASQIDFDSDMAQQMEIMKTRNWNILEFI